MSARRVGGGRPGDGACHEVVPLLIVLEATHQMITPLARYNHKYLLCI